MFIKSTTVSDSFTLQFQRVDTGLKWFDIFVASGTESNQCDVCDTGGEIVGMMGVQGGHTAETR